MRNRRDKKLNRDQRLLITAMIREAAPFDKEQFFWPWLNRRRRQAKTRMWRQLGNGYGFFYD